MTSLETLAQAYALKRRKPPPGFQGSWMVPGYGGYAKERGARKIAASIGTNEGAPPVAENSYPRQKPPRHRKRPSRRHDAADWNRGNNQRS